MIERPKRIQTVHFRLGALLPVNPPKVRAVGFVRLVQHFEIGVYKFRIRNVKRNVRPRNGRVDTKFCGHLLVHIFKRSDARSRMQIDGYAEVFVLKPCQKTFVIGEQIGVPAVTRPAVALYAKDIRRFILLAEFFLDVHPVPVHIDGGHRDRYFRIDETRHEVDIFLLRISFVSGPPVAERITRNKRHAARYPIVCLHRGAIVSAVTENVFVDGVRLTRFNLPVCA